MGNLKNEMTMTQLKALRMQLETEGYVDKRIAIRLCDCDRLSARIWQLRHDKENPMDIKTEYRTRKNRFGHLVCYAVYTYERPKRKARRRTK